MQTLFSDGHAVQLADETDFDGFRRHARRLLAQGVAPDAVVFHTDAADPPPVLDDAASAAACDSSDTTSASPLRISPELLHLLEQAALHQEPQRFVLIYRLLWRVARQPAVQHDPLDPDRLQLAHMAQAVRRDMHKMKAFVRFREVAEPGFSTPLHVAWFEPGHHIVDAVAPFFMRRFAGMRFVVLTPRRSMHWDGQHLRLGPGAARADAPGPDAGEALWLTYYAHIFNPARLKLQAMEKEMPRKYWKNLPEAVLISPLAAGATARTGAMVEAEAAAPRRRIPAAARAADAAGAPQAPVLWLAPPATASAAERLALLQARRALADHCRDCPIGAHATQTVHGEGPMGARLMVVGEQPGDLEDLRGRPLVGPSGQLFDRALAALGWSRDQLYLSNAVRHFKYLPRGKRRIHKTPAQQEAAACLHWLEEEIGLVQPAALLALGGTAARALLQRDVAVLAERGRWFRHPGSGTPVLVTLHPSALLRMDASAQAEAFGPWLDDLRTAGQPPTA